MEFPRHIATEKELNAALETVKALADAIRQLGTIPNGELYARVMDKLSLETYTAAIGLLKRTGLVEESNHVLRWALQE